MSDSQVRVKISLGGAEIEFYGPATLLHETLETAKSLVEQLAGLPQNPASVGEDNIAAVPRTSNKPKKPKRSTSSPTTKAPGTSKLGPGQYKDFKPIKLGLSDKQEQELISFFKSKNPNSQNEKVATTMYKLSELLGAEHLSYDQIHQGLRIIQTDIPKSLAGVISNMSSALLAERSEEGMRLKISGTDLVEKSLPKNDPK